MAVAVSRVLMRTKAGFDLVSSRRAKHMRTYVRTHTPGALLSRNLTFSLTQLHRLPLGLEYYSTAHPYMIQRSTY